MPEQRVERPDLESMVTQAGAFKAGVHVAKYALQLERDLAVSRAEAQAYLARIEADTTHISNLTAEVERLRAFSNAVQDIDLDVYDLARKHAALTPPAEQPAPEDDNAVSGEGGG